jgi:hypothetical protein
MLHRDAHGGSRSLIGFWVLRGLISFCIVSYVPSASTACFFGITPSIFFFEMDTSKLPYIRAPLF